MKPGSIVVVKGEKLEMTVDAINRGVVTCYWYENPAPTPYRLWPEPEYHEKEFYYHNLREVRK